MAIDKNPRQITRLRVEDQAKLERIAGDSEFLYSSLPHRLTTALEIVSERGFGLENSDATFWLSNESNDTSIGCNDDGELIISNGFDEYHLPYDSNPDRGGIVAELVTSDKLKTLFGNQNIYGSGNIDLYKHYLEIVAANGKTFRGIIMSSNNLDVTGVGTKLITLLKCKPGEQHYYEQFLEMTDTASVYTLFYNGSILQFTDGTSDPVNVTNVKDKVETL